MNIRPGGSEQRTAIVTGAARGIGAATAMALAARGIAPALFVRDPGAASGIAERIRDLGVACRVENCDVADYGSVRAAVAPIMWNVRIGHRCACGLAISPEHRRTPRRFRARGRQPRNPAP